MKQYVELLEKILVDGEDRGDRTGVGTLSIFGGQLSFDLRDHFPLVTLKKTLWKSAFIEMLWFLRGENNTSYLKANNVPIWDDWADADGNLGPIYGVQWRKWPGKPVVSSENPWSLLSKREAQVVKAVIAGRSNLEVADLLFISERTVKAHMSVVFQKLEIRDRTQLVVKLLKYEDPQNSIDQIKLLIEGIKNNPNGRRHIVTAWNPTYIDVMGLPPCHRDFQCYVSNDGHLDLMMAIRSWDTALGGPFNIAQYALLTHLIARATNLKPRHLKINYGDAHLYLNHVQPIHDMLVLRQPMKGTAKLVIKTDNTDIDGYKPEDFDIEDYEFHPFIKLPIAV